MVFKALVRKAVTRSDLDPGKDWRRQTPNQVAKVIQAVCFFLSILFSI